MPKIERMLETMRQQGISEDVISQLPMPRNKITTPQERVAFVEKMDALLSKEQCIAIMNEQGCNKTNKYSAKLRIFGETHMDKTLEEKIALLQELETPHKGDCRLNDYGTLSVKFKFGDKGNWYCPCAPVKKLKPLAFPLTYCGCCGAHMAYLKEFAFGVKLRLKEVVSSMANSDGEHPCEFIYEILKEAQT